MNAISTNSINKYTYNNSYNKSALYNSNNKSQNVVNTNKYNNNSDSDVTNAAKNNSALQVTTYTDKDGNVHRTYTGTGTDVVESMKNTATKSDDDKLEIKKRLDYLLWYKNTFYP